MQYRREYADEQPKSFENDNDVAVQETFEFEDNYGAVEGRGTIKYEYLTEHQTQLNHGIKYAAFAKCVYDPRKFNNYRFWDLVYRNSLVNQVENALSGLEFIIGTEIPSEIHGVLLGSSANGEIDFFACWPDINKLIQALKRSTSNFQHHVIKHILLDCCFDPELNRSVDSGFIVDPAPPSTPPSGPSILPPNHPVPNAFHFVGRDIRFEQSSASIALKVLGGFLAVVGAVAIVLALTLMTQPVAVTAVVVTGVAALAAGLGLFNKGYNENLVQSSAPVFPLPSI